MAKVSHQMGNGITIEIDGDNITIKTTMSEAARKAAPPSNSGKMNLLANSGGWQMIPGTDLKLNLTMGFKKAS